ncbi:MAG: class I SAM-dependent DNA methyltransferase [Alphaproteobacteria bacterium]
MRKNKDNIYKIYDKIAIWMDEHRSRALFEKPYLDRAISYLEPDATILDLGCGTGEPIGRYFIDAGFQVIGVDGSTKMLEIARSRCPKIRFILSDMRTINLDAKFDCITAWHSFFHLSQDDQRAMFKIFVSHLKAGGVLLFTSGPEAGEVWSNNGDEMLYHASLSSDEYKVLLKQHGFTLIDHKIADPECGDATVWLAKLEHRLEE